MKSVYILHHVHEFTDGHEDQKIIGVFSSEENAKAALDLVKSQPGFSNTPEGFEIAEWQNGRMAVRSCRVARRLCQHLT